MLEFGAEAQHIRTQLHGGATQGIGGLFGMASLDARGAVYAMSDMDVELGDDGFNGSWNIFLVLYAHRFFNHRPAARGTAGGERGFQSPGNPFRLGPMRGEMTQLPTWGLGLGFGCALGKGRGLPLAAPLRLIEFLF